MPRPRQRRSPRRRRQRSGSGFPRDGPACSRWSTPRSPSTTQQRSAQRARRAARLQRLGTDPERPPPDVPLVGHLRRLWAPRCRPQQTYLKRRVRSQSRANWDGGPKGRSMAQRPKAGAQLRNNGSGGTHGATPKSQCAALRATPAVSEVCIPKPMVSAMSSHTGICIERGLRRQARHLREPGGNRRFRQSARYRPAPAAN